MDIEQKIWASAAVLFLTTGMAAFDQAAWLICTAAALLLGGIFVIRNFPPVLYIAPYLVLPIAHFCEGVIMIFTPVFLKLLSGLQVDKPLLSLFLFMSAASYFCVLMMFRPVVTDFALLYSLCYLCIFLAAEGHGFGFGWPTWLAPSLSSLLCVLRIILEFRADVRAAARRDQ